MRLARVAVIAATLPFCMPSGASAQDIVPPRAPQGLFGGVRSDTDAKERLDFTLSVIEGYDSDVPIGLRSIIDGASLQSGGFSTTADASAGYNWRGPRAELGANATSVIRHYADLGETRSLGHSAGVGLSLRMPGQTRLFANQSAAYSPTYLFGLFPNDAPLEPGETHGTVPDYVVSDFESYSYTTDLSLTHSLGPRTNVSAFGAFQYTDRLRESSVWSDVTSHELRAEYSRGLNRNTTLTIGSRYRSGAFGYTGDSRSTELNLDVGIDYTRQLSATRQARYHFRVGPSGANIPNQVDGVAVTQRRYQVASEVGLDYTFERTWQLRANYRRGLEYVVDLPEPVFADGVYIGVVGLPTRRLDVSISAGYSSGESVLNRDGLLFDSYTGTLSVRYALSRSFAANIDYLYYYYDFRGAPQLLLAGIPAGLERNAVRAGLTVWVPALRK